MVDLSLNAKVTRTELGLGDLNINGSPYRIVGSTIFGGTQGWDRHTVSSPFVDGDVVVRQRRTNVTEQLGIYVSGTDTANMFTNIRDLIWAFTQIRYTLQINIGNSVNQWDCMTADYSVLVDTPHMVAKYGVVTFNIPRRPGALAGGY